MFIENQPDNNPIELRRSETSIDSGFMFRSYGASVSVGVDFYKHRTPNGVEIQKESASLLRSLSTATAWVAAVSARRPNASRRFRTASP